MEYNKLLAASEAALLTASEAAITVLLLKIVKLC